ncbi:MAG: transporter permease, partial [Actinomycetia bacterium]|nr:transporter permease [Actinomycetes bacterium]
MKQVWRVASYRFRATFDTRWGGLLGILILIALLGGLSMGAVAGARRTQSSFPAYLKSTNPSDLIVLHNDSANDSNAGDAAFLRRIARLPRVKKAESASAPSELVLGPNGEPVHDAAHDLFNSSVQFTADVSGEFIDQDRSTVTQGRRADPRRADEMVMSADAAQLLHLHVGDVVHLGLYTNAQTLADGYGTPRQQPVRRIGIKLVGIVALHIEIVRDDTDRTLRLAFLSPALTDPLKQCCVNGPIVGLRLDHGSRDDAVVEAEIKRALPKTTVIHVTAIEAATAERATEPQSIALGVFGAIAALAALLTAGQAIGRHLRDGLKDLDVLRALGAGRAAIVADALIGVVGAVVVGAILGSALAVAFSALTPFGPVRRVYPSRGIAFDWTVLGIGVAVLVLVLVALAVVVAYRHAPHRVTLRAQLLGRRSRLPTAAAASGFSVSAVAGMRLALDPGRDNRAVPVRSATLGAVLAIVVVVATVVFGASLSTLVSHPALYGWNWNYEMLGNYGGLADVPLPQTAQLLNRDPYVAGWSGASFDNLLIDGQSVPVLGTSPNAAVAPALLSGHALEAPNEVVLGAVTLAHLHKHLGSFVEFNNGVSKPTRLVVVGTATLPAVGSIESLHLEIGTGAVISETLIPAADRGFGDLPGSPESVFIRLRPDAEPAAARRSLQKIATEVNVLGHGPPALIGVQRPAEIVNYRTMGNTPALLGGTLAAGAVAALTLTLFA